MSQNSYSRIQLFISLTKSTADILVLEKQSQLNSQMGIRYSGRVPADSSSMLQLRVSYMAQTSGPLQSFPKWIGEFLF